MYWKLRTIPVACALLLSWYALTARADLAEDQYTVAAHHYSAARWQLAIEEFTALLASYPDHPHVGPATFFLAESLMQVGDWEAARTRFTQYLELGAEGQFVRQASFRLGEASYLAGDHARARDELRRFREQYPADELCAYALPYLGELALTREDAAGAREAFADALERFPQGPLSGDCRWGMARALEALGDTDGAARFYRFLAEQEPASPLSDDAALHLGMLQYGQGQYAVAVETLRGLVERFPGSDVLPHAKYWLGISEVAAHDYAAAAATLDAAHRQFDQHELAPVLTFAAADAYCRAGAPDKAEALCQRALAQWPRGDWADDSLQLLVQLAWDAGSYEQVCALGDRFVAEYPDSALKAAVQQTVARAHLKQERFERAIAVFESLADNADVHVYYLALAYLGAGRPQDALDALDRLTGVTGPVELVHGIRIARASALVASGRLAEAVTPLQAILASASEGPEVEKCRAQLAVVLARLERWAELPPLLEPLRAERTDDALYWSTVAYLAEAAYTGKQDALAEQLFRELAGHDGAPELAARGLSGLAWLAWRRDDATQAATACAELLARYPDSPLAAEAAMMRGQALEKTGQLVEAAAVYRLVCERHAQSPHASTALLSAARIYNGLQQDSEAEPLLRTWLTQYPGAPQRDAALYQLAWVLSDQGREDEADQMFEELQTQCRGSRYWADATYRLAERAARAGAAQRADTLAAEVVAADPQGPLTNHALFLRGQLAAAAKRWTDVDRAMQQLVARDPQGTLALPAQYWLAESRYWQKDYDAARVCFDRLDQAVQGRSDTWLAMIPLRRAQVRAHAQEWQAAYDIARTITARFPEFAQQHEVDFLLGRCLMNEAEFDAARQAYQRVIDSATGRTTDTAAMAQWMIGETYFMQKQHHEAIKAYYRVLALYRSPQWQAAALLQAGKCHELIGQWDEAVKLYSQILQDYPTTRVADKAAARLRMARQRTDRGRTR